MFYDDLGRVLNVKKTVNSIINNIAVNKPEQLIVQNEYDRLGQLKKKTLGANNLENLTYDYNIRGWMLGANRLYAKDAASNYFGFDLGYDKVNNSIVGNQTYTTPQFNGNIEGMVWKSKGDGEKRKYDFGYDAANRLMKGDFTQYTGGAFNQTALVNYDVKMGDGNPLNNNAYDANGNIKRMQQWGWKLTGSIPVDDLHYEYLNNNTSNRLGKVTDWVITDNKLGDFKDGTNSSDDYTYDVNGNLNLDNNKAINSITYNHLNLPAVINVSGKGTITYTYDAAGNKIKKLTQESPTITNGNKTITTTTTYIGGMVYESKATVTTPPTTPTNDYTDRLQFIGHEEGRIRFKPAEGSIGASFQYDYMLKDHLGNVRMVLTEEVQQDPYPAVTLEDDIYNSGTAISVEEKFYNIDNTKIIAQSSIFGLPALPAHANHNGVTNNNPYSNTGTDSKKVYLLNGSTSVSDRNGLGIVLKVMAGDAINIWGKSYHKKPGGADYTLPTNPLSVVDLMNLLASSSVASQKGISGTQISQLPYFPTNVTTLLSNQPPQNVNRPRASINWIILDEQFKYVSGGFDMVETANTTDWALKNHTIPNIAIPKNGYIYVYCSNESQYNVFFDNLQVIHDRGPILEETHYYPFGLTMSGISSKAAGSLENRKKFNDGTELQSKEFSDGSGLELYATDFRSYDPQLGRLWQIDPLAEVAYNISPYVFASNNPISINDPTGLQDSVRKETSTPEKPKVLEEVVVSNKPSAVNKTIDGANRWLGWTGLGWGAYEASKQAAYLGDYTYKNSGGVVQTIFDTKWGANKSPGNLGNISNYSENAQAAIRGTKVVRILKVGGKVLVVVGVTLDVIKVVNAYANGDPKAGEYARKASLNTGVAIGCAYIPVVGWTIGAVYFLGDALIPGGWEAAAKASQQNLENNRAIDPRWSARPMGGL